MNTLVDCINKKNPSYTPVWFMRQAGRYLPEFREIRKKNQDFIKLCLNSKLIPEITLQPLKRFDLDAAIIFSDILMIPFALGQKVEFKKGLGPKLSELDLDAILSTKPNDFIERLKPVYDSISEVKKILKAKNIIGFVGAPWTLLVYMLNKESPKNNFDIKSIISDEKLVNDILRKLEEKICLHIKKQIEAGADVIQIFDSWAGLLPEKKLQNYCYVPTLNIIRSVKSEVPIICFPRGIGKNYSDFCSFVKPDCISIDYELNPKWAAKNLKNVTIQGGLDPKMLLTNKESVKKGVKEYLEIFSEHRYIFNLGHGVLPQTDPEIIKFVIDIVRNKNG